MIYFVTAREVGRVKIGFSASPWRRLNKLQSDSPVALVLERTMQGEFQDEAALHKRFSPDRVCGEWFALTSEIEAFMADLPKPVRQRAVAARIASKGALGAWLTDRSLPLASFADAIGTTAATVSRIVSGRQNITLSLARKIEAETGGQVTIADLAMELDA